ncbi:chitin synthase [Seminavis robusta]|uniref:chitin synthase n=1 Tax=Seminavis robusta TaxID=568900 RepID=A0A9N8DUY4_9STRA|nr:chitin synthase [Seminavis robusta]|eukprot:Sro311_g114250.1 chitin synthase (790) ;mRNA; f:24303-26927
MCLGSGCALKDPACRSLSFVLSATNKDSTANGCVPTGMETDPGECRSLSDSFSRSSRSSCSSSQAIRVRVCGYKDHKPTSLANGMAFFPVLSAKYEKATKEQKKPPISLVIACCNEEAHCLDRTMKTLKAQILPSSGKLEIVIVMDGFELISDSMKEYLQELFLLDTDMFLTISEDIKTIIVEHEDVDNDSKFGLSLVIKRHNKGKVDSQLWWMAAHAPAIGSEYLFQTDCGIIYDEHCVRLMHERMELDQGVAGTCCMVRTMSAEQQGVAPGEIWRQPVNAILRLMQQYDMEDLVHPTRVFNNHVGYIQVIPGCGGIWRASHLGSLEEGPMKEYFDLLTTDDEGVVLGNLKISEDKVLPTLVTFQDDKACEKRSLLPGPRLCFLPDAVSYCEAEYPLSTLVKQRRRWRNTAPARSLWFLLHHWQKIVQSGHFPMFKISAVAFLVIDVLMRGIDTAVVAPFVATVIYATTKLLLNLRASDERSMLDIMNCSDPRMVGLALIPTLAYLAFYVYFVVAHTPKAKPDEPTGREGTNKETRWCLDEDSVYRPTLWNLHNVIHIALHYILLVTLYCYGMLGPAVMALFRAQVTFSVTELSFWLIIYGKFRPMKLLLHFLAFPLLMLGVLAVRHTWFPAYSLVRFSDCTWGNRSGSHESGSRQAKRAEHVGKQIRNVMFAVNMLAFAVIMSRLHNGVDIFLLNKKRYDLLFVVSSFDPYAALPLSLLGMVLTRVFILWFVAVLGETNLESMLKMRASSGPIFNSNWSESAKSWKYSLFRDILSPLRTNTKKEKID